MNFSKVSVLIGIVLITIVFACASFLYFTKIDSLSPIDSLGNASGNDLVENEQNKDENDIKNSLDSLPTVGEGKNYSAITYSRDRTKEYWTKGFYEPYGYTEEDLVKEAELYGYGLYVRDIASGKDTLLIPYKDLTGLVFWDGSGDINGGDYGGSGYTGVEIMDLPKGILVETLETLNGEFGHYIVVKKLPNKYFDFLTVEEISQLETIYQLKLEKKGFFTQISISDDGVRIDYTYRIYGEQVNKNGYINIDTKENTYY